MAPRLLSPGWRLLVFGLLVVGSWLPSSLAGQELLLKRNLPGRDSIVCPEVSPRTPTPEEQTEARRLGSSADQALILGDQERARDLLARATELDPSSAELAYRYGRILEDLGDRTGAIEAFCRALALGSREQGIGDARPRLEALARAGQPRIPEEASSQFLNGLMQADLGDLRAAEAAFDEAARAAPDWAAPVFNRGVIRLRLGNTDGALEDLQHYLALAPDAEDAILVSQRIGQLQTRSPLPSAGTAFTLGLLMPGLGQFYTGRPLGGITFMTLAGGVAAAGLLVERTTVRCVGTVSSGQDCPPERIIDEKTDRPYLLYGLAGAGAMAFIGAVEAFIKARHAGQPEGEAPPNAGGLGLRLEAPRVMAEGARLRLALVRLAF